MRKYFIKTVKILAFIIGSIVLLLILINLAIRIPALQNYIVQKSVKILSEQTGAKINLDRILISFPKTILIEGLYVEDLKKDTLAYIGQLNVNASLWRLLRKEIHIQRVSLSTSTVKLYRPQGDSAFNFDFITDSLGSSSPDSTPSEKETSPWEFDLDRISLGDVRFAFLDSLSGLDLTAHLGNLEVDIDELRLDTLAFGVDEISLKNTYVHVAMYGNVQPSSEDTGGLLPDIDIGEIHLNEVNFVMNDRTSKLKLEVLTNELDVKIDDFNLAQQKITLESIVYRESQVKLEMFSPPSADAVASLAGNSDSALSVPWHFGLKDLTFDNIDFSMDNTFYADSIEGFDPNHMGFKGFCLNASDLLYAGIEMKANISDLSFTEGHGFKLNKLSGNLALKDTSAKVKDLIIQTEGTEIKQSASFTFPGFENIVNHMDEIGTSLQTEITRLNFADIDYFVPGILDSLPIDLDSLSPFYLNLAMSGSLKSLDISKFSLQLLDSTSLTLTGSLSGLAETDNLNVDFAELDFRTTHTDVSKIRLDSLVPESIKIPANISLIASVMGNLNGFNSEAELTTTFGKIKIKGGIDELNTLQPNYDATISTDDFNTGILLRDTSSFGLLDFKIIAKGQGFDPMKMKTEAEININSYTFRGYEYNDITLNAEADTGTFNLVANVKDEYIDLELNGSYVHDTLQPKLNLEANLKGLNLKKLGFSEEDIRAKGKLVANLQGNTASNLNGKIETRDILIIKNKDIYPVDSLIFVSINDSEKTEITIQSDLMNASYAGTLKIDKLGNAITHHFNRYFQVSNDTVYSPTNSNFNFKIKIKSSALLTQVFVPGLEKLDPGTITGEFNEAEHSLSVKANLPFIDYQGNQLKNLNIDINSGSEKLSAGLSIGQVEIAGHYISGLTFGADISDNKFKGALTLQETDDYAAYDIPFQLRKSDTLYLLSFPDENIVLNSKTWQFANHDEISISDLASGHYNLKLTTENEMIRLSGKGNSFIAELANFRMSNFGNILNSSSGDILLQGVADGKFVINKTRSFDSIIADFTIRNMKILENPLGKIKIDLQKNDPGYMKGKLLVSEDNDLLFDLKRIPLDTSQTLDVKLQFNKFQLRTLNGFLPDESDSLFGWIGGEIDMGNSFQKPELKGQLTFNNVYTELKTYGTFINIDGQKISIDRDGISFPNFTIKDNHEGKLTLNGHINSDNFNMFKMDLQVDASHFRAVDKPGEKQGAYYGVLVFSTSTKVNGSMNDLKVKSGITINDATDFTMILLKSGPNSTSYKGVVEFIDKDSMLNPILVDSIEQALTFNRQGLNISANIEIEKKASLAMILDERAGDKLWVKGSANLMFTLDETGLPSLTGRYNLNDGGYKLTLFNITQREFHLQDNSYIAWTGEPMEAQIHIDANYQVETAPYNLIIDQTNNVSDTDMKQYSRKLPFTVILMIRGEINAPIINFNIELPPDKRAIYNGVVQSKLNDLKAPGNESSLNKQVLSLLAFKQFMPQNPLEIGGESSDLEATARNSVSRLLSNQLNNFSKKYIKGVTVNFDVQSYEQYSESGEVDQRTELGIDLSKSFFNNRIDVKVGSNVELESEKYRKQNSFNNIADNIEVVYKLTENGVYRVKAFRQYKYEQFEGDITESGLSFIFNKDFNYLHSIFLNSDSISQKNGKGKEKGEKE